MNVEKFIAARKAVGMSQKELSEGICTQATLSRFENNGQVPSLKILIKLCNRINLPLVDLFSSINVVNSQLDEQLEKAEFSLITSEFEQLAQILEKIDPKTIKDADLRARYYYL
ncbi:helix-turn-helix domain-containing protein, partial [Enterococcus gallinarum]